MANHVNRSKTRTGGKASKGPRLEVRSQLSDANVAATGGLRVSQMGGQKATSRRVNRMSALPPRKPTSGVRLCWRRKRSPWRIAMPCSKRKPRIWLITAVRWPIRRDRTRCSACRSSWSSVFTGTQRVDGLWAFSDASDQGLRCREKAEREDWASGGL